MELDSVIPNSKAAVHRGRGAAARERLAAYADERGVGIVLTGVPGVAWVTGGVAPPVDRSQPVDLVWYVAGAHPALITTEVERDRIAAEYDPERFGLELLAVPWFEPDAFVRAAADRLGTAPEAIASDGHPGFGLDVSDDLVALRLALGEAEQADLASLGQRTAEALGSSLRSWRPGIDRDLDVQARLVAALEAEGIDTPVVIVGGDERLRRFRHPVAIGAMMRDVVMAVVVARRAGLHVAATRFAFARPLDAVERDLFGRVLTVEDALLDASRAGATYGTVLDALDTAYARVGAPGAWREHYQGGPIGFQQREFEIAPGQRASRWYTTPIERGHALAWNPSLAGGAKVEDTYLVSRSGLVRVTDDASWPILEEARGRPAPLVVP